jgi:CRP-like cAMP-binding protein
VFEVRVDGEVVGSVGPGTVVGERARLEAGRRTADLRATTDARVAEVSAEHLVIDDLSELALGHHREDARVTPAPVDPEIHTRPP